MNTKVIAVGVLVAGFFALVVTFALYRHGRANQAVGVGQGHGYRYVTATATINQGTTIKASDLAVTAWGGSQPVSGAFTEQDEASLVGRVAAYQIPGGMPITQNLLAASGASMNLPTKVPPGMRAIAIKTDAVNDMGGFLFPGAKVDILADIRAAGANGQDHSYDVAQDITVLATGKQLTPNPSGKPEVVDIVTVLVTPEQAQKLALAQQEGSIYFTLRNTNDAAKVTEGPTTLGAVSGASPTKGRGIIPSRVVRRQHTVLPVGKRVQTILGGRVVTEYFNHNLPVAPPRGHSPGPGVAFSDSQSYQPGGAN